MNELKKLQQKRLKVNFVDDDDDESTSNLQKVINQKTSDITDVSFLTTLTAYLTLFK